MAVKGKVAEFSEGFVKKVGLFEGEILAINPDENELRKILGKSGEDDMKNPEYLKETSDGDKMVNVTIWVKDVKSDFKASVKLPIIDKPLTNRNGDKTKFINSQGNVSYFIDEVENLPDWFMGYPVRQAKSGEDRLYNFLKAWLQIDTYNDKSAEVSFDINKILRGNMKELRDMLKTEYNHTVLFNSIIVTREVTDDKTGDKKVVEYQNIFNKAFLPGSAIRFFRLGGTQPKFVKEYINEISGDYGIKDYYLLEPLQDYDPAKNMVSGDGALVGQEDSEEDSSY